MNTFVYDEDTDLLTGKYNEKLQIEELHDSICSILSKKDLKSVGSIVKEGGKSIVDLHNDPTLDNSVEMFSRVIGVIKTSNLGLYSSYVERSPIWINKILSSTGGLKVALLDRYMKMLSEYIKVNVFYDNEVDLYCSYCRKDLQGDNEYCPHCGLQEEKIVSIGTFISNDLPSAPKAIKHPFDKFWHHYLRFQGRTDTLIPKEDIEEITTYLNNNYTITNTTEACRIQNIFLMRLVINKLSMPRHKHDINLLLNIVWGYSLPNYKSYDSLIESNWKAGQAIINNHRNSKVYTNINNNNWRLWRELDDAGIEIDIETIHINSSKDLMNQMEALWELRCLGMNKKYTKIDYYM